MYICLVVSGLYTVFTSICCGINIDNLSNKLFAIYNIYHPVHNYYFGWSGHSFRNLEWEETG